MGKVIAAYGGGFKPPTKGHFEVVEKALNDFPEIDEFIIYVGGGVRDGISQIESMLIWDIYSTYLPMKVKIEPSKAPIGDIIRLGKNNPEDTVYFVIGGREGNKDDEGDILSRTKDIELVYPNMKVKPITTQDVEISGTNARKASTQSKEELEKFLPNELNSKEKLEVFNIIRPVIKEQLNENATYTKKINLINKLATLTQHMIDMGMNIEPLPKLEFMNGDIENASEFLGKTAYYDPKTKTIALYTEGRHPKDITRSYAHEMIHHIQNLEGRLGNITTTNTQEDDNLNDIEAEANLKGTMTFRNWTDSLNEGISTQSFPNSAFLFGGFFTGIQRMGIGKTIISDLFKSNPKLDNLLLYTQDDAIGFWKKLGGKIIQQGEDKKGVLRYYVQINKNDVDTNLNLKQLGISYKNLSTKKSKIDKGEYVIKRGRQKIGFFFVRDIGTIQMDPMGIITSNLNEIGDLSQAPYKWKTFPKPEGSNDPYSYYDFSTDNGTKYQVVFNREVFGKTVNYDMSFVAKNKDDKGFSADALTGGNEPLKIMSTIVDITREQIKKAGDVDFITFKPTKGKTGEEGAKDNPRSKLYKIIIKKNFPKANVSGTDTVVVDMTAYKSNDLNEAIVGGKIECDNCDWSWDIADGGNDLFICHKCGHDNKPRNEDKDYFGLNKIIKELAKETSLPEEEVVSSPPMEYKIYSDMDGVLTDFDESFKKYSKGIPPREYEKTHGKDGFWKLIDDKGKVGFWVGMPWMSDGKQYWDYIKDYDVELLSSPSRSGTSRLGKRLWVRNNMPGIKLTLAQSFNKKNYAEPNHILIDDRKSNIEQWVKAGGVGILHTSAADTINQLKSLGL